MDEQQTTAKTTTAKTTTTTPIPRRTTRFFQVLAILSALILIQWVSNQEILTFDVTKCFSPPPNGTATTTTTTTTTEYGRDICFVTSSYGPKLEWLDALPDVREHVSRNPSQRFVVFTNWAADLRAPGWERIATRLPHRRFITHSRYAKFRGWMDPALAGSCAVVVYTNANLMPALSRPETWDHIANDVLAVRDGLMMMPSVTMVPNKPDVTKNRTIPEEMKDILDNKGDVESNIRSLTDWLESQDDYDPVHSTVYNTSFFAYNPMGARFQNISQQFWERYSMEVDSWHDQPLWAHFIHKLHMKPMPFRESIDTLLVPNPMKKEGRTGDTHGVPTDIDAETWYAIQNGAAAAAVGGDDEDGGGGGESNPFSVCVPMTSVQKEKLRQEIAHYEKSSKFREKVREVRGKDAMAAHHAEIRRYLYERVLKPGWSVLELGCAAGMMMKVVHDWYAGGKHPHGDLVGIELVTGWVREARSYFEETKKPIHVFEGDMTEFSLPEPHANQTFDFVMLNDVLEHLVPGRYRCFFRMLREVTHVNSIVYAHTPTPEAQLVDVGQFYENALPHHMVISGMRQAGLELVTFEHDVGTKCNVHRLRKSAPRVLDDTQCTMGEWAKYTHMIFQKPADTRVFDFQ